MDMECNRFICSKCKHCSLTIIHFVSTLHYGKLQQAKAKPTFLVDDRFTDEATDSRSNMFNTYNSHLWDHDNPHGTRTHGYQKRFSINVWTGIVLNNLVGSYILTDFLNSHTYSIFLQEVLLKLLLDVPPVFRTRM